jgi:ParB family chromosome partitioning protein
VKHAVTRAEIVSVPIEHVVIGVRRRDKLGKVKTLAHSIEAHGLIHPILLRGQTLVAGHRRLEACRLLGWKTIAARQVERMTDEELRAIELDENTARENLSDYAMSKARLAQIRQAEADLKSKAAADKGDQFRSNPKRNSKRGRPEGRPAEPGSKREVAEATGISPTEQVRTERHVALAEAYPFMQRRGWLRHHVLDAGDQIERLPEADRAPLAALLDQDAIPPEDVARYLGNAATMPRARREQIIALSQSADEFERRRALTMIASVPPPPDPGLVILGSVARDYTKAASVCRSPQYRTRIADIAAATVALHREFSDTERKDRADETL